MFPPLAKGILVVEQRKFFNDVVHNQVDVNCGLVANVLFERLTQLTNLGNVEALIRVQLKHSCYYCLQL